MKQGGGRQKGAAFERDIARELDAELGIAFRRDLIQYQESGRGDLVRADGEPFPFIIECKRYAKGPIRPEWWRQACDAARTADAMPALVCRFDRAPVIVRIPFAAFIRMAEGGDAYAWDHFAEVTFGAFCMVARELLAVEDGREMRVKGTENTR